MTIQTTTAKPTSQKIAPVQMSTSFLSRHRHPFVGQSFMLTIPSYTPSTTHA